MPRLHRSDLLPDWATTPRPNYLPLIGTASLSRDTAGNWFWDGPIGAMLAQGLRIEAIDLAMHAVTGHCIARTRASDGSQTRTLDCPFEPESFAVLWNSPPPLIHGLPCGLASLHLGPTPADDESWLVLPIASAAGFGLLTFKGGRFVFVPLPDALDTLDNAGIEAAAERIAADLAARPSPTPTGDDGQAD